MSDTTVAGSNQPFMAGYFDLAYYGRLWEIVKAWRQLAEIPLDRIPAPAIVEACHRLLHAEARLIDAGRLHEWLELFTEDCAYWVPTDVDTLDPRKFVTWEFNDRRRLEERVERLDTGRAYSQEPATRTTHLYSNIEAMSADDGTIHVLCNFLIQTNLLGRLSQRAGWNGYILRKVQGRWRIVLKRINLFDADLPQDNNSFTL